MKQNTPAFSSMSGVAEGSAAPTKTHVLPSALEDRLFDRYDEEVAKSTDRSWEYQIIRGSLK